jgi:hypothetical protein
VLLSFHTQPQEVNQTCISTAAQSVQSCNRHIDGTSGEGTSVHLHIPSNQTTEAPMAVPHYRTHCHPHATAMKSCRNKHHTHKHGCWDTQACYRQVGASDPLLRKGVQHVTNPCIQAAMVQLPTTCALPSSQTRDCYCHLSRTTLRFPLPSASCRNTA